MAKQKSAEIDNVVDIEDYKPHVNFYFEDRVEVFPLEFFEGIVSEKYPLSRLTKQKEVMLAILEEWLIYVRENNRGNEY